MIQRRLGNVSNERSPVESTSRRSSSPLTGIILVSEPVAIMILTPLQTSPEGEASTVWASTNRAFSRTSVMLGLERMPSTP